MRGWKPIGEPFRRLLNHNKDIPPEASRMHGYTREILERDGEPPQQVYSEFREYAGGLPVVSCNIEFDWDRVLVPEWHRLGISPIGGVVCVPCDSPNGCLIRCQRGTASSKPCDNTTAWKNAGHIPPLAMC